MAKIYRIKDIGKRFNLDIKEFLELPREWVELLIDVATEETLVEQSTINSVETELKKTKSGD